MKLKLCKNCFRRLKPFIGIDFVQIEKQGETDLCDACGDRQKTLGTFNVDIKEWNEVISEAFKVY